MHLAIVGHVDEIGLLSVELGHVEIIEFAKQTQKVDVGTHTWSHEADVTKPFVQVVTRVLEASTIVLEREMPASLVVSIKSATSSK